MNQKKSKPRREDLRDTDWAWLAGLIEGEGCISVDTRVGRQGGSLTVNMTDRDVIEHAYERFGGFFRGPKTRPDRKPVWQWSVGKKEHVQPILENIRPYMGQRRGTRIDELLSVFQEADRKRTMFEHGTRRGYDVFECRCLECREANAERGRQRRKPYAGKREVTIACIECRRESSRQSFVVHWKAVHDTDSKIYAYHQNRKK